MVDADTVAVVRVTVCAIVHDVRVLAALDKFKGTATSAELGAAVAAVCRSVGASARVAVLSDGGEGLLDAYGGANRTTVVTGPLGVPVVAAWRLDGTAAVLESAQACGLVLAGGRVGNDPMAATSTGVGELVEAAVREGATRLTVGVGGSACTDGGLAAVDAISGPTRQRLTAASVELVVACDVTTHFEDAVRFAPQKGATDEQVYELRARLQRARRELRTRFGLDVGVLPGAGAAGGLAGGLAALGAQLRPGFDVVADEIALATAIRAADLVITGEGQLDDSSFEGKVVGGVAALAASSATELVVIVGADESTVTVPFEVVSLTDRFGARRAHTEVLACVRDVTRHVVSVRSVE